MVPEQQLENGTMLHAELRIHISAEHYMGMPAVARHRWTAADVRALMDESRPSPRYELLDGELLVTPAPDPLHQLIVAEMFALIKEYVDCEAISIAFTSPADIELAPETIMQPDVFLVSADAFGDEAPMRWSQVKRLLLAVEVLSPSTMRQDRVDKRDHYLANGVEDYWIIDPDARVFECWSPRIASPVVHRERVTWHPTGARKLFALDVREFFARRCRLPRR
jgi:Uma2 family endonuclease